MKSFRTAVCFFQKFGSADVLVPHNSKRIVAAVFFCVYRKPLKGEWFTKGF